MTQTRDLLIKVKTTVLNTEAWEDMIRILRKKEMAKEADIHRTL